jgi:hypothetical protein
MMSISEVYSSIVVPLHWRSTAAVVYAAGMVDVLASRMCCVAMQVLTALASCPCTSTLYCSKVVYHFASRAAVCQVCSDQLRPLAHLRCSRYMYLHYLLV